MPWRSGCCACSCTASSSVHAHHLFNEGWKPAGRFLQSPLAVPSVFLDAGCFCSVFAFFPALLQMRTIDAAMSCHCRPCIVCSTRNSSFWFSDRLPASALPPDIKDLCRLDTSRMAQTWNYNGGIIKLTAASTGRASLPLVLHACTIPYGNVPVLLTPPLPPTG